MCSSSPQLTAVACALLAAILFTGTAADASVPLGGRCNSTANCSAQFSECYSNVCQCPAGRVASVLGNICLVAAQYVNGSCSENIQCSGLPNTACIMYMCACANGFAYYHGSCIYNSSGPGGAGTPSYPSAPSAPSAPGAPSAPSAPSAPVYCTSNSDCRNHRNTECRNNACTCRQGYRLTADGQHCSAGTSLRSLVVVVLLGLLLTKVTV